MDVLLKISLILFVGLIGGRIAQIFKLPNVSGYLVAGLFLGPSFLRLVTDQDITSFFIISELALALIAFSIGSELVLKNMLKFGKSIVVITVAEVAGALIVVFSVMYFIFDQSLAFSLVIASMSAATAPAATLLVIRQYNAQGPLTKTILPVVALDDVLGIMAFGVAMSIAKISTGQTQYSFLRMLSEPIIEIGGSLLLGGILGIILVIISKKAKSRDELQIISLSAIGLATGLAKITGFSSLLTCIVLGAMLINLNPNSKRVFDSVNGFVAPVYVMFFALAGASLHLNVLYSVGAIGIAYVISRLTGKLIGAWIGAKVVKAEKNVQTYLGLTLLPQGGISIGLSVLVRQQLPQYSQLITTIIMFSVLIYEVLGPIIAKVALQKAGEINVVEKKYKASINANQAKASQA